MNTSQYTKNLRRDAKRVSRHPVYQALQKRTVAITEQHDKVRRDLHARDSEVERLTNEVASLRAALEDAKKAA